MDSPEPTPAAVPASEPGRTRLPRARQPAWRLRPAFLSRRRNRVVVSDFRSMLLKLTTLFYGPSCDNIVRVGRNFRTRGIVIIVEGADNRIEIGDDVRFNGEISVFGFGQRVTIGDRCDFKTCKIVARDGDVAVGSDCLVAAGTLIRTNDVHTIADRTTGRQINPAGDVVVGNGVWIAEQAALLKGSRVPDGCVVGFRSVLTSGFEEPDCVLAGVPARVVRRGISWTR